MKYMEKDTNSISEYPALLADTYSSWIYTWKTYHKPIFPLFRKRTLDELSEIQNEANEILCLIKLTAHVQKTFLSFFQKFVMTVILYLYIAR